MLSSSTLISLLLSLALAALPAGRGQTPAPSGPALLRRVLAADGRVAFRAKQTVVLPGEAGSSPTVTDEVHDARHRSSLLYLLPPRSAGLIVVNDGRSVWEYNPDRKVVARSPARDIDARHSAAHVASHILCSYRAQTDAEAAVYGGREAWILRITPVRADRPRYVWWVDKATSLVLKREVYTARGSLRSVASYSAITFPTSPPPIASVRPPGCRVVTRAAERVATTLQGARQLAPRWAKVPVASLGSGFELDTAQLVKVRGKLSLHVQYTDGLATVSLFQIRGKATLPAGGREVKGVRLPGGNGSLLRLAPFSIVSWQSGDVTYNLVADLTEHTLVQMARFSQ